VKVIVSHNSLDFDALASLALARLLHPGAVAVALGGFEEQVRAFARLYRAHLELEEASDVSLEEVSELIVVDTADPKRIAPMDALFGRVPVTVYDHHPKPDEAIPASGGLCRRVGATATILTLLLKEQGVAIPAEVASLGLLGIHEDTGNLSYALTTPDDYEAAAHLLRSGAQLALLREFSREHTSAEGRQVFKSLLESAREETVGGQRVVVARFTSKDYVPGISPLANRLMDLYDADAALVAARMDERSLLIARAKADTIDVGAALEALGGGGHTVAAFASTELSLDEALAQALEAFGQHATSPRTAAELMSRPVVTVAESSSLAEAKSKLERHGYSGLVVVDEDGRLKGILSRRDLDKAVRHGLGETRVKGYMSRTVITAEETASQRELALLVQKHNIGRIPILRGGELVGVVSRSDLLAALHAPEPARETEAPQWQLLERLPAAAAEALEEAKRLCQGSLYLVGGTVRDALLGAFMQDLDLVVEDGVVGDRDRDSAERLGAALQRKLGGSLSCHLDFGTCTLLLPGGLGVDIATAREEFYPYPGALPEVSPSSLLRDLSRRDFSLNALALRVLPEPPQLVDPFGGLHDLKEKTLRALHPLSFIEDPTRILRGARLAARLKLRFHPDTRAQVPGALAPEVLGRVSRARLRQELLLSCAERQVGPVLALLDEFGVLEQAFSLPYDPELIGRLDEARQEGELPDETYTLALLLGLSAEELARSAARFHWPRRWLEAVAVLRAARLQGTIGEEAALLEPAAKRLLRALGPRLERQLERLEGQAGRQRLRGQDVLDLGLREGPEVGRVLAEVRRARADGRAASFEEELALARRLVAEAAAGQSAGPSKDQPPKDQPPKDRE
jgi:tRNA nucleotidyltransferase (CCA-adding enzyme)